MLRWKRCEPVDQKLYELDRLMVGGSIYIIPLVALPYCSAWAKVAEFFCSALLEENRLELHASRPHSQQQGL